MKPSDDVLLDAVKSVRGRNGVPTWATLWDVQAHLNTFPPKVTQRALESAIKRGILKGCACGCRGDFEIP